MERIYKSVIWSPYQSGNKSKLEILSLLCSESKSSRNIVMFMLYYYSVFLSHKRSILREPQSSNAPILNNINLKTWEHR